MRKYLAKLDWNNMLMHKIAIECWNIVKYEIESIIDKFVPFQKQGKRCRKKHLSKEAIRQIMLKQTMWRVYRRTRKEEDYAKYKEALNAATTEIRQSKRSFEQKLACNIKNDSKSFYAYVRSKQNVQDKVGPLEDSAGNIISQGFLMAEDLNGYFSSVFTKEDISLPVADAKFQGAKSDYLGPLVVENKGNEGQQITGSGWDSSKITNGNSRTNQYTTCKSIQLVIKRGSCSV